MDDADAYVDARNNMVDGQIRPNKVTDRRLLAAMRSLPREAFLPPACRSLAYADTEVPLGGGRTLLSPLATARLIQAGGWGPGDRVLVLGAGYTAALLACCGVDVFVVEDDAALLTRMAGPLARFAPAAAIHAVPLAAGLPAEAPFDGILIDGAVATLPQTLGSQLRAAPPGRLIAVLSPGDRAAAAVAAEWVGGVLVGRPLFDCAASLLPQLRPAPVFAF